MKTVIVLVALALVGGHGYPYHQDVDDVTTTSIIPAQTIGVKVLQVPQHEYDPIANEVPPNTPTDGGDSTSAVTETRSQYTEQDMIQQSSSEYYTSSKHTPPRGRSNNLRGSVRFVASQQPQESDIIYVRQPQRISKQQTSTSNYYTEPIPNTTEYPRRRFPQQPPNAIHQGNTRNIPYDQSQTAADSTSKLQKEETKPKGRGSRHNPEADAYIVRYSNENNVRKGYKFGYETSNHLMRNEQLVFEDPENADQPTIYGGYEFTDPAGGKVIVTYTAGIFGFKPVIKYIKP